MIIAARFNGPPGSGNGGYSAGLFASTVDSAHATVTLRQPPPLETPLQVRPAEHGTEVYDGERLIASATPAVAPAGTVGPVPLAAAREASTAFGGFADHPFPTCYVCGPRREDGLRIFPGPVGPGPGARVEGVARAGLTAAPWPVPSDVSVLTMWAALDCPGGWAIVSPGRPYVLGRMTAAVDAVPGPGSECVVVGELVGVDGRKASVRSAVYGPDGSALARAEAIWIAV